MEFWGSQREQIGNITNIFDRLKIQSIKSTEAKKSQLIKWWYKSIVSSDSELHKIISNVMTQQWEFNEWVEAAEKLYISTERVEDVPKIRNRSTLYLNK